MAEAPKLSREVLPPYNQSSGLGVMLVAATAMFFAVASSAFVLRARMARSHCPNTVQVPVVIEIEAMAPGTSAHATAKPECGAAVLERRADQRQVYAFSPCDKALSTGAVERPVRRQTVRRIKAPAQPIEGGILIDKVHLPKKR